MRFYCQEHDYAGDVPCTTCEEIDAANGIAPKSPEEYISEVCDALNEKFGGTATPVIEGFCDDRDVLRLLELGCGLDEIGLFSCINAFRLEGALYSAKGAKPHMVKVVRKLKRKKVIRLINGSLMINPKSLWVDG